MKVFLLLLIISIPVHNVIIKQDILKSLQSNKRLKHEGSTQKKSKIKKIKLNQFYSRNLVLPRGLAKEMNPPMKLFIILIPVIIFFLILGAPLWIIGLLSLNLIVFIIYLIFGKGTSKERLLRLTSDKTSKQFFDFLQKDHTKIMEEEKKNIFEFFKSNKVVITRQLKLKEIQGYVLKYLKDVHGFSDDEYKRFVWDVLRSLKTKKKEILNHF